MFPSLGNDETAMILELQTACDLVPWLQGVEQQTFARRIDDFSLSGSIQALVLSIAVYIQWGYAAARATR